MNVHIVLFPLDGLFFYSLMIFMWGMFAGNRLRGRTRRGPRWIAGGRCDRLPGRS